MPDDDADDEDGEGGESDDSEVPKLELVSGGCIGGVTGGSDGSSGGASTTVKRSDLENMFCQMLCYGLPC